MWFQCDGDCATHAYFKMQTIKEAGEESYQTVWEEAYQNGGGSCILLSNDWTL